MISLDFVLLIILLLFLLYIELSHCIDDIFDSSVHFIILFLNDVVDSSSKLSAIKSTLNVVTLC